jgi:predicted enzyme related to lactoylglutathione lyase
MDYRLVNPGGTGGIGGGIMKPQDGQIPAPTMCYIDVDDLAAYGKKIVAAGGTMIVENQEVPGMGAISLFLDPEGRMTGLWKAA